MSLIVILCDSLRPDHLGCYGNQWIKIPNIDRFAQEAVLFEEVYPEGFPTVPARTALFTGKYTFPFRGWQPLEENDLTLAEILGERGYVRAMITDVYHLFKPGMNLHRGFNVFRWIRGQEGDAYVSSPRKSEYVDKYVGASWDWENYSMGWLLEQYLKNVADRKKEEEYFVAQVIRESMQWLDENYDQDKFFLWVDCFDPHEPWDPPYPYRRMYDPDYQGKDYIHPKRGSTDYLTKRELEHIRALYAGEVSFVDKWVGLLLDKIRELGFFNNSIVVFLSDPGEPLGEHGVILKEARCMHPELIKIPLLVRHPRGPHGKRISEFVQTQDFACTMLNMLDISVSPEMHGENFWTLLTGDRKRLRDRIFCGFHFTWGEKQGQVRKWEERQYICVRDKSWSLILAPKGEEPKLFHLPSDPHEMNNVYKTCSGQAQEMKQCLDKFLRGVKE